MYSYPRERLPTVCEVIARLHETAVRAHTIISPCNVTILSNIHPMGRPNDLKCQP